MRNPRARTYGSVFADLFFAHALTGFGPARDGSSMRPNNSFPWPLATSPAKCPLSAAEIAAPRAREFNERDPVVRVRCRVRLGELRVAKVSLEGRTNRILQCPCTVGIPIHHVGERRPVHAEFRRNPERDGEQDHRPLRNEIVLELCRVSAPRRGSQAAGKPGVGATARRTRCNCPSSQLMREASSPSAACSGPPGQWYVGKWGADPLEACGDPIAGLRQ